MKSKVKLSLSVGLVAASIMLSSCASNISTKGPGVRPNFSFPVTNNETPYSQCLNALRELPADNLPVFSVGEVADKTGQINFDENGHALTQGASEMVISALAKTGKVHLVERLDLRIPLAEVKLSEQKKLSRDISAYDNMPASDFIIVGALTELNYNIVSGGGQLFIRGMGGGARQVIINVAMDLRVIDAKNFAIRYVSPLQKQIVGYEIEANVFRFFGDKLIEFDAGVIRNEPMQLGVRAIAEMSIYQIMTEFLGLPEAEGCGLVENGQMRSYLEMQPEHNL